MLLIKWEPISYENPKSDLHSSFAVLSLSLSLSLSISLSLSVSLYIYISAIYILLLLFTIVVLVAYLFIIDFFFILTKALSTILIEFLGLSNHV